MGASTVAVNTNILIINFKYKGEKVLAAHRQSAE